LTVNDDLSGVPGQEIAKVTLGSSQVAARPNRERDEFEIFYRTWYDPLLALLLTLTADEELAEDVVQDTMLAMRKNWAAATRKKQPKYLFRIGIRILRRTEAHMRREGESFGLLVGLGDPGNIAADTNDWVIEHVDLVRAIRSLPRRQGEVVALFHLCDFSIPDIAYMLGLPQGTVKYHLHHGRKGLQEAGS
jgi:RNA polymerase sigma-70 factor (ECF subfamily)